MVSILHVDLINCRYFKLLCTFVVATNATRTDVRMRHFAAGHKSILANQYYRKYCSRSLSNKEPLYIFMQKRDVTVIYVSYVNKLSFPSVLVSSRRQMPRKYLFFRAYLQVNVPFQMYIVF